MGMGIFGIIMWGSQTVNELYKKSGTLKQRKDKFNSKKSALYAGNKAFS